ncbi:hypothetical protein FOCC_FOCC004481 [Frankliniella occidentalis]|nr:hypothetical protein FOCC_FOCC004481 [Frankliniella occidentalis]
MGVLEQGTKDQEWSEKCIGHTSFKASRCEPCTVLARALAKNLHYRKGKTDSGNAMDKLKKRIRQQGKCILRLKKEVKLLHMKVEKTMKQMSKIKDEKIEETIQLLPPEQQSLVRACFEASKHHNKKNRRYATDWIYECILMRIKAPSLYEKLRTENKLALPSKRTLNRYMENLRPCYGFQENVFEMLKVKATHMPEVERHGCIAIDEMSLESRTGFDKNKWELHGFVQLGGFESEEDKLKRGDHALVILFQPFRGRWVQAVGAFLSAGAVKSGTLHKLILEAVALLERSGFYVDAVTTDGATWNRSMWDLFGVDMNTSSCEHPVDAHRLLRFASDFPHLVKNIWTRVLQKQELNLPEGKIKLDHWRAILDNETGKGIKADFTLTRDHLEPTNYQKMKFFGERVATSMEYYRAMGDERLKDSEATIEFIRRMNSVIDAMNGQLPWQGLQADPNSQHHKVLTDFLDYLKTMNDLAMLKHDSVGTGKRKKKNKPHVSFPDEITTSSYLGLVVTVNTALSLVKYLTQECGYKYLMTRRINQDSLEHFFGHIRGACGANNHPDPLMFINVYRLLMTYSLVKPPRGSNVSGGQMLEALLEMKDVEGEKYKENRKELEMKIDEYLDQDIDVGELEEMDHQDALTAPIDTNAMTVFGGYISRKMRKMQPAKSCLACSLEVCAPERASFEDRETLLQMKSRGGLLRPSHKMYNLLMKLEESVLRVAAKSSLHATFLFSILDDLLGAQQDTVDLIGCAEHQRGLTTAIISHYLNCRMHFVCAEADRAVHESHKRKRDMAKRARLNF